jgi:hypothetical protein
LSQEPTPGMLVNYRRSGRRGTVHPEFAPLEGEAGGYSVAAASATDVTVYTVPSQKVFHLKTVIAGPLAASGLGAPYALNFYVSTSATGQKVQFIGPSAGQMIAGGIVTGNQGGGGDIQGLTFGTSGSTAAVYAQVVNASLSIAIFVGGQLRDMDQR